MACKIEGKYPSKEALMKDQASTVGDLNDFSDEAEGAVKRCNKDKELIREALGGGK